MCFVLRCVSASWLDEKSRTSTKDTNTECVNFRIETTIKNNKFGPGCWIVVSIDTRVDTTIQHAGQICLEFSTEVRRSKRRKLLTNVHWKYNLKQTKKECEVNTTKNKIEVYLFGCTFSSSGAIVMIFRALTLLARVWLLGCILRLWLIAMCASAFLYSYRSCFVSNIYIYVYI